MTVAESSQRTPYGVYCTESFDVDKPPCNSGQILYLTEECYNAQMERPDSSWRCPRCGGSAYWSDSNYEDYFYPENEGFYLVAGEADTCQK